MDVFHANSARGYPRAWTLSEMGISLIGGVLRLRFATLDPQDGALSRHLISVRTVPFSEQTLRSPCGSGFVHCHSAAITSYRHVRPTPEADLWRL